MKVHAGAKVCNLSPRAASEPSLPQANTMKKTLWILLTTFALATFATVPVMASPAPSGKASLHNAATVQCKKHKKHGKKHHKKSQGAAKNAQ
jgi:hypothetical protein